jgi:hypothetical protein
MTLNRLSILMLLPSLLAAGCASHYIRHDNGSIDFYLRCPDARKVEMVTSLDGFEPRPARRTGIDKWVVSVKSSRDFSYFYRVDGEVVRPDCRLVEQDDFGGSNCIYSNHP